MPGSLPSAALGFGQGHSQVWTGPWRLCVSGARLEVELQPGCLGLAWRELLSCLWHEQGALAVLTLGQFLPSR